MPNLPSSSPPPLRATVTARVDGSARLRALHRLSADSVTVAPATDLPSGTIVHLTIAIARTLEVSLRAIATAVSSEGTQVFRAGNAEALQILHLLETIAGGSAGRSRAAHKPLRRVMVRLAAEPSIFELIALGLDEFVVTGSNLPTGIWTMATFGQTDRVTIRTPVIAGRIDDNHQQTFAVATEDGRHLLALLATFANAPTRGLEDLPSATVLPESVPYRPFVAPPLVS